DTGETYGSTEKPTNEEIRSNTTRHVESFKITYDPNIMTYETLDQTFWQQIDPTDAGGQFNDRGESYTTAIFYHTDAQKEIAQASKQKLEESNKFSKPIVTKILPAQTFYSAEEAHQNYYEKQPFHYRLYHKGSGREDFIKEN